ncbi:hypothetical protein AQ477_22450 [Burkholderia thailandensis]|nr:hypothetical protein AQ477_22450 [Burkholderia thailandensis]KXF58441.1 hypothetical protein AQ476_27580 [Burkholderia thailandensis]PNE78971.1 hypothetical protein A8H37_13045 [Burkholderia thailandensis]
MSMRDPLADRMIRMPIDIAGAAYGARRRRSAGLAKPSNAVRSASRRSARRLGLSFRGAGMAARETV